jgi:membrane-associated protease RseP (regulator of RpoE activity)
LIVDLAFRLFGIPVQVNAFFLLTAVILGPRGQRGSWMLLAAVWVVIVFVSVLLHELGHALVVKAFGRTPSIQLHAFGGLTAWRGALSPGRRVLVGLAGPGVGIVVGVVALVPMILLTATERHGLLATLVQYVVWVNLGWGLLNLLPMLPLDGGAVMAAGFEAVSRDRGVQIARVISLVLAVGFAILALLSRWPYGAILCALFAYTNYQALQAARAPSLTP